MLNNIITISIMQYKIPEKNKISILYPKYKKGSKDLSENYRPKFIVPTL